MAAAAAAEAEAAGKDGPTSPVGVDAYQAMSTDQMKEELKKR
jgi:hypothetical protein